MRNATIRELLPSEVHLCVEGGKEFFAEAKLPGGFDPEFFVSNLADLIKRGIYTILGAFDGETIVGALAFARGPNLFNPKPVAYESWWYVLPDHRGGSTGIRLLRAFEELAVDGGAKLLAMVHTKALQPERLGGLFVKMGYTETETAFVKEVL